MITLKFKTITPLHISNGNELAHNLHYVVVDNQIFVIDTFKMSSYLSSKYKFDFSKDYSIEDIRAIINSRREDLSISCVNYSVNSTDDFLKHLDSENRVGLTYILEFINSCGRFYIPASSAKGALLNILHLEHLGIKEERKGDQIIKRASMKDKFVIHDSDFISEDSFIIFRTGYGRPPVNIMCLDGGKEFSLNITKQGSLLIPELKTKLKEFYPAQILKAKNHIKRFIIETDQDSGAKVFDEILTSILDYQLKPNEYLINLGFGGGSWFKLYNNSTPPTFYNKKTKSNEEAHTTFVLIENDDISPLGWCTLTIEEKS